MRFEATESSDLVFGGKLFQSLGASQTASSPSVFSVDFGAAGEPQSDDHRSLAV